MLPGKALETRPRAEAGRAEPSVATWTSPADGAREGGDWCEALPISANVIALTVGDVCGHGSSVAPAMRAVRASVLEALRTLDEPATVLGIANAVAFGLGDEIIVTAIVAFYDKAQRTLAFANAGHPPPLLVTHDRTEFLMRPRADVPLGVILCHRAYVSTVRLPADALVVLYTDGITEHRRDPIGGEEELKAAARLAHASPERDAARTIAEHVLRDERGQDDAATLVLRATSPVRPVASRSQEPRRFRFRFR